MAAKVVNDTLEEQIRLPDIVASHQPSAQVRQPLLVRNQGRFPRWLRLVDAVHRADRMLVAGVADAAVITSGTAIAGVPFQTLVPLTATLLAVLYVAGWYRYRSTVETQGLLWSVSAVATPAALTTLAAIALAPAIGWPRADTVRFGIFAASCLLGLRVLTWVTLVEARRRGFALRRTLIVGDTKHARLLSRKLVSFPEAGLLPVAMLPCGNGHGYTRFLPPFPEAAQLSRAISDGDIEHVVLAPNGSEEAILECVKSSGGMDVAFSMLPPMSEFFLHPGLVTQVGGLPLIPLGKIALHRPTVPGKRLFDIVGGSLVLLALTPVLAATALAIKIFDRGPVFYRQRRVGRDGRPFYMMKFRSMVVGAERLVIDLRDQNINNGLLFKVVDDPRITRVGRFIRRLSIDELPQVWNVIRGEMSLVGPRPLPVEPEDFGPVDNQRHAVRPGITGYWQVAGAHELSYEEMIKLDLAYIENWSLWLDVRLMLRTGPALLRRRGPF
jgi:exopolysaccharide biosynthesis polyprenyl glycosylphosphotransferase